MLLTTTFPSSNTFTEMDSSKKVGPPSSYRPIGPKHQVEESERLQLLQNPPNFEVLHNAPEGLRNNNSSSDADAKSLLLGLFIYGKDFASINRFLEKKSPGEVQSFYYGKFYKSPEHQRWSNCGKIFENGKYVRKPELFSDQKTRELLLSRLTYRAPKYFRDALQQNSKSYSEKIISLDEYISSLKSRVGLEGLVRAVGIGEGKEDLTNRAVGKSRKRKFLDSSSKK